MHRALFVFSLLSVLASAPADAQIRDVTRRVWEGAPEPGYVPTPYGWAHESCVGIVTQGAHVQGAASGGIVVTRADGARAERPPCRYKPIRPGPQVTDVTRHDLSQTDDRSHDPEPTGAEPVGWAANSGAYAEPGTYWTQLHTTWTVPAPPRIPGAQIYFFNALQTGDGNTIVQPVLQYGPSAAIPKDQPSNFWAATSWIVYAPGHSPPHILSTDVQPVASGEQLTGHIASSDCNQAGVCSWSIWLDGPRGVFGWLNVANEGPMLWAFRAVAEFYKLDVCEKLPISRSITFSNNRVIDSLGRERDAQVRWNRYPFEVLLDCGNEAEHFLGGARLTFWK